MFDAFFIIPPPQSEPFCCHFTAKGPFSLFPELNTFRFSCDGGWTVPLRPHPPEPLRFPFLNAFACKTWRPGPSPVFIANLYFLRTERNPEKYLVILPLGARVRKSPPLPPSTVVWLEVFLFWYNFILVECFISDFFDACSFPLSRAKVPPFLFSQRRVSPLAP